MSEEWCREKLEKLQIEETRLNTLAEIRDHLSQCSTLEAAVTTNFLASPAIFNCVEAASASEQSTLACDILSMCMSQLELDEPNFSDLLEPSLQHSNWNVRLLALNELIRILQKKPQIKSLDSNLTLAVIACLDAPETTVGAAAIEVLSRILLESYGELYVRVNFLQRLDASDIVRCRVYEVAVNLARTAPEMLDKVEKVLAQMISELDNEDVLLKLNILELLVTLAEQNHGLIYLENKRVFEKVTKQVEQINKNPLGAVLVPGYMKFFGKIAYAQPQKIILGYPDMVLSLFDCLVSGDIGILPTALDTIGNLAHSSQGKIILETNYTARFCEALETIGQPSQEICEITKKWHRQLTGFEDFRFMLEFSKNPFPDIKIACLSLVKTLCMYDWAVLALRDSAGFIEYLLDRRVEFNKDVLFFKYEINTILSNKDVFDGHTLLQLRKYVEDGVLYVQGIVEVAVDGS